MSTTRGIVGTMSFTTILGIMVGLGLFVGSIFISTDNYLVFLSLSSALMVVGGTLAATFIAYEARYVLLALRLIFKIFRAPQMGRGQLTGEVGRVVKWGYLLQKKGINALEQEAERVGKDEPFLGWAMEVVITGYDGEETAEMLHNAIDNAFSRPRPGQQPPRPHHPPEIHGSRPPKGNLRPSGSDPAHHTSDRRSAHPAHDASRPNAWCRYKGRLHQNR